MELKRDITEEALFRYCNDNSDQKEKTSIEQALAGSEELRAKLESIKTVITLTSDIKECQSVNVEAAYAKVSKYMNGKKQNSSRLIRFAAILSIPLLISTFILSYLFFVENAQRPELYSEIFTFPGTITRHELPDHTIVWLNSNSKLRYPVQIKDKPQREVELEGEAYFDVHADRKHPFYVNTPDGMRIYAYGTKFNVNTYNDENFIEAVLEKGKINVIPPGKNTTIVLNPGEGIFFDKSTNKLKKSVADIYEKTAWKDGKLIFRNSSLEDVLKKLSKAYNVDITFDNKSGKEYRYRATFTTEDITQILDYLSKSANLKWKMKDPIQREDSTFTRKQIIVTLYK